ncbi:MAG: hypothetical protein DDT34_02181 [Firmicutes bacterium]|nr:hypothetical protein [Bacillota bacterium]
MREEKAVGRLLRKLTDLIVEEAESNEVFAQRLRAALSELSLPAAPRPQKAPDSPKPNLPDVHAELASRGESEFRLWLLGQSREVLRAIIRSEDIDPTRRTAKWKDVDKLADYVAESLKSRQQRGASFLTTGIP